MKKLFYLFICFMMIQPNSLQADIIPENAYFLSRTVKIVNLNEYPNVVLIGCYTGPMIENFNSYIIENNKNLEKGYKFNRLNVYWKMINEETDFDMEKLLLEDIQPYGYWVEHERAKEHHFINSIDTEYAIAGFSKGKLVLYKSKETTSYLDNRLETKIEIFKNPLTNKFYNPNVNKLSLWQKIKNFFQNLFS